MSSPKAPTLTAARIKRQALVALSPLRSTIERSTALLVQALSPLSRSALTAAQRNGLHQHFHGRLYEVSPLLINKAIHPKLSSSIARLARFSYVLPGPWDRATRPYICNEAVRQVLSSKQPYTETEAFKKALRQAQSGTSRRYKDETHVHSHFRSLQALCLDIETRGYRTQQQLGIKASNPNEVGVYVDRGGHLIWASQGDHRLSIARMLGLARIPIAIRGLHDHWVAQTMSRSDKPIVTALEDELDRLGIQRFGEAA